MSNYEYLRSLPIEEMAEKFMDGEWCDSHCELCADNGENCIKCMTAWLKSESGLVDKTAPIIS